MTDDKIDAPSDAPTKKSDALSDAAPTTENKGTEESPPKPCTPDDLIELIRAIKFSHTDMSIRNVHNEISVTMAQSDESYAFLSEVKLNDVKKVWKKALKGSSTNDNNGSSSQNKASNTSKQTADESQPPPIVPTEGVIKFYTVGDGSVKSLAENYTNHHAKVAIEQSQQQNDTIEKGYAHFFLDVPADLSGSRPHQALINYQENHKSGGKGKGKGKKNKKSAASHPNNEDKEIFKIQLPALPGPGMEDTPTVLLLYNSNRSAKTFVHPPKADDKDDDGGYAKIRKMIIDSGISGALGTTGGSKAYFYGFITKTKSGPDVVSIDVDSGVVKDQSW